MIWIVLYVLTLLALGLGLYALGRWHGAAVSREESQQRRLEALAMGRDPKEDAATVERAVITSARIMRSHPYDPDNNGNI